MRNLFLKIPWWVYAIGLFLIIAFNFIWMVWGGK